MTEKDDELAHTATAVGEARPAATAVTASNLGRYRLEHKLGEGGMGVVHAAFDPDLERRVALKVLRSEGSSEARQRLLREARAMARLTHPNVVVVHEVGNAHGRDFVAMELIDGETLSDWLKAEKREPEEILAAFIAAGRGLAAAHAAELVHRDFKPHNILRGKDRRIVVTDFGLARGVEAAKADAFETTVNLHAASTSTPSSLSGLTQTGSVLGTPAYMAPEQWNAQTVGPAADQFAFCVALWEALVGERPYRGDTIEQLRTAVDRGPDSLDASRLPRRLRKPILRGLDPDPAKRWPNMDALLAHLSRASRSRLPIVLAAAAAIVVILAVAFAATRSSERTAAAPCVTRDVAAVWSPAMRQSFTGDRAELAAAIDANTTAWKTARDAACTARDTPKVACLDGSLARTEAIILAVEKVTGHISEQTTGMLIAPEVCTGASPPRFTLTPTPDTIAAFALYAGSKPGKTEADEADAAALAAKSGIDPCARTIALLTVDQITTDTPRGKAATLEAVTAADACGDDRLRADAILAEFMYEAERPTVGPRGIAALKKADVAVKRVAQPDLTARIDSTRATYAAEQGHWDEAFVAAQHAVDGFAAAHRPRAQIREVEHVNGLRFQRHAAGDMEAVRAAVAKWRPVAVSLHADHLVDGLDGSDAYARLFLGDVASAHPDIMRLWQKNQHPPSGTVLHGTVVDDRGNPVAGATVAAGNVLFMDAVGPLPFGPYGQELYIAVTDAHGAFDLAGASPRAVIVAQSDPHHRSAPTRAAPNARLVLHATRRIAGTVATGTTPTTRMFVMAALADSTEPGRYSVMSPIRPDGSYALEGAPTVGLKVGVAIWGMAESSAIGFQLVPAGTSDLPALPLAAAVSSRTIDVIVRSATATPFESAQVYALSGKHAFTTIADLTKNHHVLGMQVRWAQPIVGETMPAAARGLTRAGDLVAHFTDVNAGDISICVMGLNVDISDPVAARRINAHREELLMSCISPDAKAPAVVVEAPAQKRYDD